MNEESAKSVSPVPEVKYFDKATDLVASYDQLLASLYAALIAGLVLLLLKEEVSLWVGAPLLVALVLFVLGMGHTLLHMAFHGKMLLLLEALVNGTEHVPNAIEEEEPTVKAYARIQAYVQRAYAAQLLYLFFGICFGGVAVLIRLWEYAYRAALLGIAVSLALMIAVVLVVTWKKTIRRFGGHVAAPLQQERTLETKV